MKFGRRRKSHKGRAAIRHYAYLCEPSFQALVARVPPRVDSVGDQHLLGSVFTGAGAAVKEMDLGVKWTPWTASRTPRELVLF